jgi:hypothetical protein
MVFSYRAVFTATPQNREGEVCETRSSIADKLALKSSKNLRELVKEKVGGGKNDTLAYALSILLLSLYGKSRKT